jgi:hypothetical protein
VTVDRWLVCARQVSALREVHASEVGRLRTEMEQHVDTIGTLRRDTETLAGQHAERTAENAQLLAAQQAQLAAFDTQKAELGSRHAAAVAGHQEHAAWLRETGEAAVRAIERGAVPANGQRLSEV